MEQDVLKIDLSLIKKKATKGLIISQGLIKRVFWRDLL